MFKKEPKKWDREKLLEMAHIAKLFNEPLVKEFFDLNEYRLWKEWTSQPDQTKREQLFLEAQGLAAFRSFISETIQDGIMAQREVDAKNQEIQNKNRQ